MSGKVSRRELARVFTEKLLAEPQKQQEWVRVLAAYIVENNLTEQVDTLLNDIAHELYAQAGELNVEVVSVETLSQATKDSLSSFLKDKTGASTIKLHETTDPALLGGLIARTPDAELDASVATNLRKLSAIA